MLSPHCASISNFIRQEPNHRLLNLLLGPVMFGDQSFCRKTCPLLDEQPRSYTNGRPLKQGLFDALLRKPEYVVRKRKVGKQGKEFEVEKQKPNKQKQAKRFHEF